MAVVEARLGVCVMLCVFMGVLAVTPVAAADAQEHQPAQVLERLFVTEALEVAWLDNTATDGLVQMLGRETVEAYAPGNEPFLTTREAFVLKDPSNADLLERYREAEGDPDRWQRVAFKGGSEPGVFNLTTGLTDEDGVPYCVSATWNDDEALDEVRFLSLYGGLLESVREME